MHRQRSVLVILAGFLVHPSFLALYTAWVVAFLLFAPGQRLRMAGILGATTFGAWQVIAAVVGLARHRLPDVNRARLAIGVSLLITAFVRYHQWLVAELLSDALMLSAILILARSINHSDEPRSRP
jgi:hypothetical protein